MSEKLIRLRDYLGPYDYRAGFIYFTILIFNLSNLRSFTFDYEFGWDRINFFLIGFLTYLILGVPLYLTLRLFQVIWRNKRKSFGIYILELWIGALITLISIRAGQVILIPALHTQNFLVSGIFTGELITRFFFALIFVAITHNGTKVLSSKLEEVSDLNRELNTRYSQLIHSDEEIRTHASRLLHDRIQSKLMLAGAKLTRISGMLTEEGKIGIQPVIKELEQIRSIDVREVSQLLAPSLAGEGLIGSCENLCREYQSEVNFVIDICQELEEIPEETKLGIYRIIEQGVINSIKHGPAEEIVISVVQSDGGKLVVEVKDDGPGLISTKSGTGTVIIDAWVSKLEGRKEIQSTPGLGYTLRVLIP